MAASSRHELRDRMSNHKIEDDEDEEDDSEHDQDDRRHFSKRGRESESPERGRESPDQGQSIEFYDDGYEARRHQPWDRREQQRASVKNSLDHSMYLSPRITNLNDSFTSSRPSRLESIPEAG